MSSDAEAVLGIVCAVVLLAPPLCWCAIQMFRKEQRRVGVVFMFLFLTVAVVADIMFAGDKPQPVVRVKDIEIKSYRCDHTGAEITWACGTNVVVGVDKFIIQRAERQIPARTRWSDYRYYDETYATNWATATPQHAQDVRFRVIVRKEMQ